MNSQSTETASLAEVSQQQALQNELAELVEAVGPGRLVDLLLERAFQLQATDVHLDPTPDGLRVRLRVDGLLHDVLQLPAKHTSQVLSRIKLLANMDITERRVAQDGHICSATLSRQRDIRVGSGPTIHGERLVLRLMPDHESLQSLSQLGFSADQTNLVHDILASPYGMILSVGPVGSGKSTTLYACLEQLNSSTKSIVTIEDPVERQFSGVNQVQVDPRIEFQFSDALRGALRQDPNVMMVGEVRDRETAEISVRAGLTGVVVLSTLHASDSASSIDVFREFGVPAMFLADSLRGVIAQRLVRKLCADCKQAYEPKNADCEELGIDGTELPLTEWFRPGGCDQCFQTGYCGRTGVFEVLPIAGPVREAILHRLPRTEIKALAQSHGLITLEQSTRHKVTSGITSVEEMHRVLSAFPHD